MVHYVRSIRSFAISAAVWAFLFAATNLYWGLGGTFGIETLGQGIAEMADARDAELLLMNWVSVAGKFALGLLALALLLPWSKRISYFLHVSTWIGGILLTLYGVGNVIQHALMLIGSIPVARLLRSLDAVRWHLLLWDPLWLIGGILFLLLAKNYQKTKRAS
jgi:hypothetical protein